MTIPNVERGKLVTATQQNTIIEQVNTNTTDIAELQANPGGGGNSGDIDDAIQAHVVDPTPHPIYDDIPSLTILFENGLV